MGGSFGGIETMLAVEKADGIRAAVNFAGGAQTWRNSPDLRERLLAAARNARVPVFFSEAENDSTSRQAVHLGAEMARVGKPHRVMIYPPWGSTARDGHVSGARGSTVWEGDVVGFLNEHLTRSLRRSPQ